jgi:hypothetical protein
MGPPNGPIFRPRDTVYACPSTGEDPDRAALTGRCYQRGALEATGLRGLHPPGFKSHRYRLLTAQMSAELILQL